MFSLNRLCLRRDLTKYRVSVPIKIVEYCRRYCRCDLEAPGRAWAATPAGRQWRTELGRVTTTGIACRSISSGSWMGRRSNALSDTSLDVSFSGAARPAEVPL